MHTTLPQADRHTQLSSLLLNAEKASDSLERMLAVCRAVFCFITDVIRPGRGFQDVPVVVLGQHYLSHRELSEKWKGDPTRVYLQEICAYDPSYGATMPGKYKKEGHTEISRLALKIAPVCRAKVKKEGLIGTTAMAYIECSFEGESSISFRRHAERYLITLPSLILIPPTSAQPGDFGKAWTMDIDGTATVQCRDTGLEGELKFKAFQDHRVKGTIYRLAGEGTQRVAKVEGQWDGQVEAQSLEQEASGILFDIADLPPSLPYPLSVNISQPGPRFLTRLWSAILESLLYATAASGEGKRAVDLVSILPVLMRKSLLYEVAEGAKGNKAELDGEAADAVAEDTRPLPPITKIQRAMGQSPIYQLHYRVQAIPEVV